MKNIETPPVAGARVRVRQQSWRIECIVPGDASALVMLAGIGRENAGQRRRVVTPIDRLEPIAPVAHLRRAGRRHWRRALRTVLLGDDRFGSLKTLPRTAIDLLPHQMAPALAVVNGETSRVLIADEVGLGKTIQAGLILAELEARGAVTRALVLCPAGLREQWTEELAARFHVTTTLMDAALQRQLQSGLPLGVNPWQLPSLVVSSLDYVKRPEVMTLVTSVRWDLLIVDEAHHAALPSDRRDAVVRLAALTPHVVLLTATPHSGDDDAFAALCSLGGAGDTIAVFRRTRLSIGQAPRRRIRQLAVRMNEAERRMRSALARFARTLRTEHGRTRPEVALGLSTLQKRACSSAHALEQSVRRRLLALSNPGLPLATQMLLPWYDEGEFDDADAMPAWNLPALADFHRERILLTRLADAALAAAGHESKLAALRRLVRRIHEPVLVFTEYRDTLLHVQRLVAPSAAIVHGGMPRAERRAALEQFARGGVLLATDAAGEGLNLQHSCRLVVNLELPWNPMRLEQRIGRVDRLGQSRTVHAVHLIGRGSTEARTLQRLEARVARAQASVGATDPLRTCAATAPRATEDIGLEPRALAEVARLQAARALREGQGDRPGIDDPVLAPLVHRVRGPRLRARTHGRHVVIYRSRVVDATGRTIGSYLVAALLRADGSPPRLSQLEALAPVLTTPPYLEWRESACAAHHSYWTRRIERERWILERQRATPGSLIQPGLFDARQRRLEQQRIELHTRDTAAATSCLDTARRLAIVCIEPFQPLLVLHG